MPTRVFDMRGRLWFFEFAQALLDGNEVRTRVLASNASSWPVIAVEVGAARNLPSLIRKASKLAMDLGLRPAYQDARVICYSYPKVGLAFLTQEGTEVIIDLLDRTLHQQKPDTSPESFFAGPMTPSSPLGTNAPSGSFAPPMARLEPAGSAAVASLLDEAGVTGYSLSEFRLPGFVPLAQETGSWCAAAVGCMVLRYFGVSAVDQEEVASKMEPENAGRYGITPLEQVNGLNKIQSAHQAYFLDPEYDPIAGRYNTLTAEKLVQDLNPGGNPSMWNLGAHVVAICGYVQILIPGDNPTNLIWVCDPNGGVEALYFWSSMEMGNLVRALIRFKP